MNPAISIHPDEIGSAALYHRPTGIHCVQALVSHALGEVDTAAAAMRSYVGEGANRGEQKDLASCERLFAALGRGTFAVDEAPQANVVKLTGNFLIAATIESAGQATALAEKAGLDPRKVMDFFAGTMFASTAFTGYAARVATTEFEPAGFAMPLALKDMTLALQAGQEVRAPLPFASLIRDRLLTALARGRDSWDWSGLASVAREEAGLPPRRT